MLYRTRGATRKTPAITLRGTDVKMQRNLAKALAQLLELGHRIVWADALSIKGRHLGAELAGCNDA